ncbi:MAG TPA: cell division protein FtsL [Gemmatimonadaceae bacterium]|nr:cell division protein FtsL [Gemmatimonadaceae bacterium]
MATRRVRAGRRTMVALALLGFVLVAASVIWRRTMGMAQARQLTTLQRERRELDALRARLELDVRDASSRQHLFPIAERRLGMHVPSDTQVVILRREP